MGHGELFPSPRDPATWVVQDDVTGMYEKRTSRVGGVVNSSESSCMLRHGISAHGEFKDLRGHDQARVTEVGTG